MSLLDVCALKAGEEGIALLVNYNNFYSLSAVYIALTFCTSREHIIYYI